jgi:hypothetical protein
MVAVKRRMKNGCLGVGIAGLFYHQEAIDEDTSTDVRGCHSYSGPCYLLRTV